LALQELYKGQLQPAEALTTIRSDLLDAYQSRLAEALHDLEVAQKSGYKVRQAELKALAAGYFEILAPAYTQSRGNTALQRARAAFASGNPTAMERALEGFRAAPLSPKERSKRAGQTLRFLSLVPVEYARGVSKSEGRIIVTKDLEITEAITFRNSAASAWADLEPLLVGGKRAAVEEIRGLFAELEAGLQAASLKKDPPSAASIQATTDTLNSKLQTLIPAEWRRSDPAGDFEVIRSQLRALANAVAAGTYELAETTRIDAYAVLESGSEARLRVFTPQLALDIEGLFWNNVDPKGLARLIREKAKAAEVEVTLSVLEAKLGEASHFLSTDAAPTAVLTNAAVIVFREGLEAVLILAALLGSLKRPEVRRFRKPLWAGTGLALIGTVVTWFAIQGLLTQFARFGERLEAIVSIIAIAVLLLIMNWFFHNIYWTDRLAAFHQQKHRLLGAEMGQMTGLILLGLTAIYREGFETVLFLQSLVLQSSVTIVLEGIAVGLLGTVAVGALVFLLQAKLPYKRMLILTGVLICAVLFVMVGNTVHVLQLVGWLPIHPLPVLFPYWLGLWAGTYATWEGLILQTVAVTVVVGSYFAAESLKGRKLKPAAIR
jgi:high-affinity iron transporter